MKVLIDECAPKAMKVALAASGDAAIEFLSSRRAGREPVGFFRQGRTMLHNLSQLWMVAMYGRSNMMIVR
jgi:hypothetical protein